MFPSTSLLRGEVSCIVAFEVVSVSLFGTIALLFVVALEGRAMIDL